MSSWRREVEELERATTKRAHFFFLTGSHALRAGQSCVRIPLGNPCVTVELGWWSWLRRCRVRLGHPFRPIYALDPRMYSARRVVLGTFPVNS